MLLHVCVNAISRFALSLPIRKKLFWNGVEQVLRDSIPHTDPR